MKLTALALSFVISLTSMVHGGDAGLANGTGAPATILEGTPSGDAPNSNSESILKIRRNLEDLRLDVAQAAGSKFSFTRDNIKGTEQWLAQGIIALTPEIQHFNDFALWSTFDRVDVGGTDEGEVNSLGFGLDLGLPDIDLTDLTWIKLSGGVNYHTDFDFHLEKYGAHLDILPISTKIGLNGGGFPETSWCHYATTLAIRLEASDVNDPGNTILEEKAQFSVGGVAGITVWPKFIPDNRLALSVSYMHHETFGVDTPSPHVFAAEARFKPVKDLNLSLFAEYRYGRVEDTLEEVDLFSIGLTFAY